jgi:hypothetical protein
MDDKQDSSNWHEMFQYCLLKVFADDELIDPVEWTMLEKMALADGVVDMQEKMVLAKVFDRVDFNALDPHVCDRIKRFRALYGV